MTDPNCQPILTVYVGDDVLSQQIAILKNGLPVDLTGVTDIEIDFANDPVNVPPQPAFYQAKKTGGQIAVVGNPILGIIALTLTSAVTALFKLQTIADLDVIVTDASSKQQTYRASKSLTVLARNT